MSITNDGDLVRGLGFVTLYAGYLEEQVDSLLFMLQPLEPFPEIEQRWSISRKLTKAIRLIAPLSFGYQAALLADLGRVRELFEWRNEIIHGRIYGNFDRPDTLTSGRPNVPERPVDAAELYELANSLNAARSAILRPMLFQLPQVLLNQQ